MKNVLSSANIFCSCRFEVCLFHCCICIVSSSSDPFDKDVIAKCSSTLYMEGWNRWDFYPLSLWLINNTLTEKCIVLQTQCGTISTSLNMQVTPLATCAHFYLVLSLGCAGFCGPFGLVHPVESSRCNYFSVLAKQYRLLYFSPTLTYHIHTHMITLGASSSALYCFGKSFRHCY